MPSNIHASFRQANSADIAAMSRIRLSVKENILSDPRKVTRQMYEDYLERDGRGWVAESDGRIVAFSYADRVDGSIWALFVDPGHEGQGLAKALLRLATEWLFELGHSQVALSTTAGTRADRFYAAQGWLRTSVRGIEVDYQLDKKRPVTDPGDGH